MKNIRVRATTGELVVIANADLLKSRIQNFSRMTDRTVTFTVILDAATTADAAARVPVLIRDIISAQTGVLFRRSHVALASDRGISVDSAYTVTSPAYLSFMEIQQATTLALLRALEQAGIALAKSSSTTVVVTPATGPATGSATGPATPPADGAPVRTGRS
jgi:small-conductance mechanosensitive channel